jgi:hypothetical protein
MENEKRYVFSRPKIDRWTHITMKKRKNAKRLELGKQARGRVQARGVGKRAKKEKSSNPKDNLRPDTSASPS